MEEKLLKKCVMFEHPPSRSISVFKTTELYTIFGLLNNNIYVSQLSSDDVSENRSSIKKFDGEVLEHEENIVGILQFDCKYYGIDQFGSIISISKEISNDSAMDYDIFEDLPEKREKWVLKDKKNILSEQEVITFCLADKQLALLVNSENMLSLEIIDFFEVSLVKSITIRSPGLPKDQKFCTLIWLPPEKNIKEFSKNWFLNFEGNNGLFVITMPEGNILVIDPNESNPEFLYAWPFRAVSSYWIPVDEGASECTLIFVTEGNSILKMSQYGEVLTEYLPIDSCIKAAFIKKNLLYISDWSDTVKYYINECQEKSYALFLKGILCFGNSDEDFSFALSKNGEVYIVYDNYKASNGEVILPDSSLTAVLIEETTNFEKINKALLESDAYTEATNIAIKNLPFSVNAQVIYARKMDYTICVSLKCLQEGILIEKHQGWNLFLSFKVGLDVITLSHKMRTDLISGNIWTDVFSFSVHQSIADLNIKAKFIYTRLPEFAKFIPVIYVGEVYLDPCYFLQPALEVELSEVDAQPSLEEILKKDSAMEEQDMVDKNKKEIIKEFKLQVEYREPYPNGAIFKWLLCRCKPLWRSSLWSQAGENKKLKVAILGNVVTLEDCETCMIITGKDIRSCYALKRAIYSSIPGTKTLTLPIEDIKQLEIYERTSDLYLHENPSLEELEKLRENFRKTVTSQLKP